jgi:hypothetical protein
MVRTLWDALGEIEDRRGRKGRQYALRAVLGISIAAMLAGANDLIAIFRWGRRLKPEGSEAIRHRDRQSPLPCDVSLFLSVA